MGRYTQQKLRMAPLTTVPVAGGSPSPSGPPVPAPVPTPTPTPTPAPRAPRPVVVVAHARAAPLVASPPRRLGALQMQPAAVQRGAEGEREREREREALKRAREENDAREAERVALERQLAQMRAEQDRLARDLAETRRDRDRLVAENTLLQRQTQAQQQQQQTQSLRRQASDVYATQPLSQGAAHETFRQQTWPLVMRRLLLAEQALHADARRCRRCRAPVRADSPHQQQQQQAQQAQQQQEGDALRGAGPLFQRRPLSPALTTAAATATASAGGTGGDGTDAAADERQRTAQLFTDVVRALCNENASCARALPLLDGMVAAAEGDDDVPRRAEVALRVATILVDSCDYCRAAVVAGFTQALPTPPSAAAAETATAAATATATAATTAAKPDQDSNKGAGVGQHVATSSLLVHTVRNASSWIRGTDPAPPLTVATLRFLCTTLPCCTDDGLRASAPLLQCPGLQDLLRHARGSPHTGPCRDVLALVRVFLRVTAARAQPVTGRHTPPSLVDRLCLLLYGRHRAGTGAGAAAAAGTWAPQSSDVPVSEDAEAVLRLQHSVVRFLLTALSSCSWTQWGSDGTSTATSSVPGTAHSTTLPLPSSPRPPPQGPQGRALLTYNYNTLVQCAVNLLNTTIARFGADLPAHSALVCDLCDLLCLCSCNEDAFAAGYVSLVEKDLFQSTVSKLDKCVAPFRTRHPKLAVCVRRLTDLVTQHAPSPTPSQQPQDQGAQGGDMN